ncbi:hypothetical protein HanIR_Chr02g0057771 [Helianthus annuus]|nr:hypothetical protein HanIR_Chr02g0057771 [Helianthus annuus]
MFFKITHRYHWTARGSRFRPGWVGGRDTVPITNTVAVSIPVLSFSPTILSMVTQLSTLVVFWNATNPFVMTLAIVANGQSAQVPSGRSVIHGCKSFRLLRRVSVTLLVGTFVVTS